MTHDGRRIAALMRSRLAIEKDRLLRSGRANAEAIGPPELHEAMPVDEIAVAVVDEIAVADRKSSESTLVANKVAIGPPVPRAPKPRWVVNVTTRDGRPWGSRGPPFPTQDQLASGPHAGLDGERLDQVRVQCGRWAAMIVQRFGRAHKGRKIEASQFARSKGDEIEAAFWKGRAAEGVLSDLSASWAGGSP